MLPRCEGLLTAHPLCLFSLEDSTLSLPSIKISLTWNSTFNQPNYCMPAYWFVETAVLLIFCFVLWHVFSFLHEGCQTIAGSRNDTRKIWICHSFQIETFCLKILGVIMLAYPLPPLLALIRWWQHFSLYLPRGDDLGESITSDNSAINIHWKKWWCFGLQI